MSMQNRRTFLKRAGAATAASMFAWSDRASAEERPPNVVFILTDDQGYGDLGCTGSPVLRTPRIDSLCRNGARFARFHVSPVCTPTRACLMTGRYNYRTRAIDTYQGRAMMDPAELTVAEMLSARGYRTGIFGKWHLGDNYPMRAMDQGFQESLVHKGGGICQPSEPDNTSYFDTVLVKNGKEFKSKGYCTDVFTDAAVAFIEANAAQPFFAYCATNAPHDPAQVEERYWKPYADQGMDERTARIYGMIANIDENVGRLLDTLDRLKIADNTIVVFMTDNGPACGKTPRYNAGMRGGKGSVYEGGIRVPCFVRWPGRIAPNSEVPTLAAHIDFLPTVLEACGLTPPADAQLDGRSLWPLLKGEKPEWPDRTLFIQWHRGDAPEAFRDCAAITQQYKLVNGRELYDLQADPAESKDIAADHPDIVQRLRAEYEAWFKDVSSTRGYDPPRIVLGTPHENPSVLTRQDWRGPGGWGDGDAGYWEVNVAEAGRYRVTVQFSRKVTGSEAVFRLNGVELQQSVDKDTNRCTFPETELPAGDGRLETWIALTGEKRSGAERVWVERE
jgi:arylsulfatase A-like enzyme